MDVPKERSGQEIRKYLDLRVNDLKLRAVDGLSVGMARLFSLMVILMLAAIVLAAFAFGTLFLLGDIIGSMAAAAFIIFTFIINAREFFTASGADNVRKIYC